MYVQNSTNTFNTPEFGSTSNKDIDELLRGEISATEAYHQVLESIHDAPEIFRLKQFLLDHEHAVQFWRKQARMTGKIPECSSRAWGDVVEAFIGVSKVIGEETALAALKKGEEYGLSIYEKMLDSEKLTEYQKNEIRNSFIPRQIRHIESIDALIEA